MAAAAFGRAKRVTDPLADKVKARLRGDDYRLAGYVSSSGSEHERVGSGDLSDLIHGFFFDKEDGGGVATNDEDEDEGKCGDAGGSTRGSDGEADRSSFPVPAAAMIRDLLNPKAASAAEDRFRRDLVTDAMEAVERFEELRWNRSVVFRRAVMESLRESGYNAGICKARWESSGGGLTAGSYEYIDVVRSSSASEASSPPQPHRQQQRYIVDVGFAGEFEIARPTAEYGRVVGELPRIFVGRAEELKRVVRILADAAKRSLRSHEMHVPPWRKVRYMQAKWLGPYRRTINPAPAAASSRSVAASSVGPGREVKCRTVGFDTAARHLVIPPATRSR